MTEALRQARTSAEPESGAGTVPGEKPRFSPGTAVRVLAAGVCYYLATQTAWTLTFPDSKVSLFFFPHAVLVAILLLVPTRHWWAYTLAAASSHFFATQQAGWPPWDGLQCEVFDAAKYLLTAAGIRAFVKTPFEMIGLREAVIFVLVGVVIVPLGTAFWGAAFTLAIGFGTDYWLEWRNLGISNGVATIVLVPFILIGANRLTSPGAPLASAAVLESILLAVAILVVAYIAFYRSAAGPDTSPALLYSPIPLLIWAALRFGLGGVSSAMLAITVLAIAATMQGHGPFLAQAPAENVFSLQMFLLMAATPLMLLAAAINDERRSKEALRVSEDRMALAVESAQLTLWDWDAASDRVWTTESGQQLFGIAPGGAAVQLANLAGRVHPDDAAVRTAAIRRALETRGSYEVEYRLVLPDDTVRWIAARGRYASSPEPGAQPRILGVSMDITRQKQEGAETLQLREELAHLSRVAALSALSGSLAHELNQPLASILSNAQAGERFLAQDPPDLVEIRAILADIVSADRRAGEIIHRLRDMVRRGKVALQPVRVDECIAELLGFARSDLLARGVSVANLAAGDLPPVMTDRVHLQQVLLNLILNACDAMESIPANERKLTLTTSVAQGELRIGVLDCGVGLPDDIETLFQPFHTTKDGGLGMGLSICRTLVASHGGRLWAERRDGPGAAFHVALPLAARGD